MTHPVRRCTSNLFCSLFVRPLFAFMLVICVALSGCAKPQIPSITGAGAFHDIGQCRKGMSANEVRGIMGGGHKNVMEEGIRGMDGGNYTWVYPEGKVHFNYDGVTSVEPIN